MALCLYPCVPTRCDWETSDYICLNFNAKKFQYSRNGFLLSCLNPGALEVKMWTATSLPLVIATCLSSSDYRPVCQKNLWPYSWSQTGPLLKPQTCFFEFSCSVWVKTPSTTLLVLSIAWFCWVRGHSRHVLLHPWPCRNVRISSPHLLSVCWNSS